MLSFIFRLEEIMTKEGEARDKLVGDLASSVCEGATTTAEGLSAMVEFLQFIEDTMEIAVPRKKEVLGEIHEALSKRILN